MAEENIVDYTTGVFKRNYTLEGCKYYYIVAPEFYGNDEGLDFTGAMLVTLCYPKGTIFFKMVYDEDNGNFVPENPGLAIDRQLLLSISEAIHRTV
ncbi:MAG TPA: hypothetical protein VMH01_11555 [Puia sp.]|nr:hypothetical protein [Puia sp.]